MSDSLRASSSRERDKDDEDRAVWEESDEVELATPTPEVVRPEDVSISFCETTPYLGDYQKHSSWVTGEI